MFTIHVASMEVVVKGRLLQRCAVCGCKLVDSGAGNTIVITGMTETGDAIFDPPVAIFEPRTLVAEREGVFRKVIAPDDFYPESGGCVELVEG